MANPTAPTLNSPISGVKITDNTPTLSFNIPTDADNNKLVFKVDLDTHNPIQTTSGDYLSLESRLSEGSWEYHNGSGFVEMPAAGVENTYYGNEAKVTIPAENNLRNDIWYWQIYVSDQLTTVKYGTTATFAQNIFG